jgi:hypothetical protein
MRRQRESGSPKKRKRKSSELWSGPLSKDWFSKSVEIFPDGSRKVSLSPAMVEIIEHQREMFREKFGREIGPHDPIFFDPGAAEPRPLPPIYPTALESLAVEAGVRPEVAHAIVKTGVFLMMENEHLYTDEDKADYQAAVEEYRERAKRQDA